MLHHPFNWKRLSLVGALAYEPDGSDDHLFSKLCPGAYNDETLIEFLTDLHEVEQRPMLLIWDGLPSHRSRRMRAWVDSQCQWLSVEPLPGYAPDINPIEQVWGSLKSKNLPTCAPIRSARLPISPKTAWTASAATHPSASLFCATLACDSDDTCR